MLPLSLLNETRTHPMLVELKSGETLNGHLVNCDTYMNLTLKEVVLTAADGERFYRLGEAYVRGNNIKYLRIPEEIVDIVKTNQANNPHGNRGGDRGGHRGDGNRGDRGRGDGRGRGGRGGGRGGYNRGRGRGQ